MLRNGDRNEMRPFETAAMPSPFLFGVFRQLSEAKQKTTRYAGGR
jgi:hypothetical protein